jgi:cytochrome P450
LALCFQIYLLGLNPDMQDKARREVISIMGDVDPKTPAAQMPIPTHEEINRLKYVNYVIKETFRLYPRYTFTFV